MLHLFSNPEGPGYACCHNSITSLSRNNQVSGLCNLSMGQRQHMLLIHNPTDSTGLCSIFFFFELSKKCGQIQHRNQDSIHGSPELCKEGVAVHRLHAPNNVQCWYSRAKDRERIHAESIVRILCLRITRAFAVHVSCDNFWGCHLNNWLENQCENSHPMMMRNFWWKCQQIHQGRCENPSKEEG